MRKEIICEKCGKKIKVVSKVAGEGDEIEEEIGHDPDCPSVHPSNID